MAPRGADVYCFNSLNDAAGAEQWDLLQSEPQKRSTRRRLRRRRRDDSKPQPAAAQTLHFSSSGEDQTAGGITAADEILKPDGRWGLRVAVAARNACQPALINLQLKLSESENGARGELIHDHHTHFVGLQRVQYFLY